MKLRRMGIQMENILLTRKMIVTQAHLLNIPTKDRMIEEVQLLLVHNSKKKTYFLVGSYNTIEACLIPYIIGGRSLTVNR